MSAGFGLERAAPAEVGDLKAAAANAASSVHKVVLIADNHSRLTSLLHWLADTFAVELKTTRIPGALSIAGQTLNHVELPSGAAPTSSAGSTQRLRLIGVEFDALLEANVQPVLANASVVFLLTRERVENEASLFRIFASAAVLFERHTDVRCLLNNRLAHMEENVRQASADAGCEVSPELVNLSDFKRFWTTLIGPLAKPPQAALPSAARTSVFSASSPTTIASPPQTATRTNSGENYMANLNESLNSLMSIEGALGCFVADYSSGMLLAKAGGGLDLDMAAAGNTEVIKAKIKTMASLGLDEVIEDILITLGTQYHIMRPVVGKQGLFLYIALDKSRSNLALARFKMLDVEKTLTI